MARTYKVEVIVAFASGILAKWGIRVNRAGCFSYDELRIFAHEALLWHLNLLYTAGIMSSNMLFHFHQIMFAHFLYLCIRCNIH